MTDTLVSWSGGKDSAMALAAALADDDRRVVGLLSSVGPDGIVSIHGVDRSLLEAQAAALDLPLTIVTLPRGSSNEAYQQAHVDALRGPIADGVTWVTTGDLHLADVRAFRERVLAAAGVGMHVPLWGLPPAELAARIIDAPVQAVVCAVDTTQLDASFVGRRYDHAFVADLPAGSDPCGEGGEFHTFVTDGPGFAAPVEVTVGQPVLADGRFAQAPLTLRSAD